MNNRKKSQWPKSRRDFRSPPESGSPENMKVKITLSLLLLAKFPLLLASFLKFDTKHHEKYTYFCKFDLGSTEIPNFKWPKRNTFSKGRKKGDFFDLNFKIFSDYQTQSPFVCGCFVELSHIELSHIIYGFIWFRICVYPGLIRTLLLIIKLNNELAKWFCFVLLFKVKPLWVISHW